MNQNFIHQAGAVAKVLFARLRFLSVFLVAALVVGYWDNIKNYWDKWTRPAVAPDALAATTSDIEYYCAMHPNIVRSEPGNCPICGMPLIKRKKGEQVKLPEDVLARVQLSPQRIALAGVQTTVVEPRPLVHEVHAVGVLDYNETKVAQLSVRVAGRADELFIQYTGQAVKQGDPIYSLYSPELYGAQREYLLARKRVNQLPPDASPDTKADVAAVYNATLEKLVLWGVTRDQLDKMDKEFDQTGKIPSHLVMTSPISGIVIRKDIFEGGYVNVGDKPYTIADLGTLWLQAKVYERDVPLVQIGQPVEVNVEAMPQDTFKGTVTFRAFQVDPQTRTLDARIEVKNTDLRLRPGMFADAAVRVPVVPVQGAAATQPENGHHAPAMEQAKAFQAAMERYLQVQTMLAQDKADNATALLREAVAKIEPVSYDPHLTAAYNRLTQAVEQTAGQDIKALRQTFKEISAAMIEIGKATGLPPDAPAVQVFRCPMAKANWLQTGSETANPFYGSAMLTCGGPIEQLPKVSPQATPATQPAPMSGPVLAVPRSAVIDTGRHKIVYAESSAGVYDMRAVKLGALAGEYYPVLSGLEAGDRVVTAGAFLIDAENRLNPAPTANTAPAPAAGSSPPAPAAHQH